MSVIGIDFGYQNSSIAAAGRGGVDVILNGNSQRLNPTMVGFDEARSLGENAQSKASSNFKNTITSIKRLIGLAWDDPRAQTEIKKWCMFTCVPFKHATGGKDSIGVQVNVNGETTVVSMEAITGMMLKHMGGIAAAKAALSDNKGLTEEQLFPQDWVVSIPSYYTDSQRRALLAGAQIVRVNILRLMHENTATALAYGIFKDLKKEFEKDKPTNVMFIDIGASAYTVSMAAFEPGKLTVKSSFSDQDLGGRDFDLLIAEWIAAKFEEKYKGKLSAKPLSKPKVRIKLLAAAEKAKKTLSPHGVREARINMECLMDDFDFSTSLKADEYEKLCAPLLARLAAPVQRVLEESKLTASELASVEIVGGSTRINSVKRELLKVLGIKTLSTTMNADESVTRGTALQSAILSPRFKVLPYEIQEAQPFPIKIAWDDHGQQGVEVDGDAQTAEVTNSVVMFNRGLNFPIVRRVTLRRSGEFQVTSSYDVSAASYGLPSEANQDIASFNIKGLAGDEKKVRVNVKQDIHGIVHLSSAQMVEEIEEEDVAIEVEMKKEGEEQKQEKKKKIKKTNLDFSQIRPLDWSQEAVNKAYEAEVAMANQDRIVRETSDMRNELESYIYGMRDKITSSSQLAGYATEAEKAKFQNLLEKMENWLYEDGFDATKSVYAEKLQELTQVGGPIEVRQSESQTRPGAVAALQKNLDKYKQWLNSSQTDAKYAHITDDERSLCHKKCDEISSWIYEMLDKQGALPLNVDPLLRTVDIHDKSRGLASTISPVQNKPAPKKPEPEAAPAKETESKPDEPTPMEGVEKENGEKAPEGEKETEGGKMEE